MSSSLFQKPSVLIAVLLSSVSVLLFEMVQIRLFSYSLPPILAYAGISLAMTGFGIGAMLLSLVPSLGGRHPQQTLWILLLCQAAAMVVSTALFAAVSWDCVQHFNDSILPLIFQIIIPCTLPYFFGGLFFAFVFSSSIKNIGKIYFFNLVGSGIGAVLITLWLTPVGAESLVPMAAALSAVAAILVALPAHRIGAAMAAVLLAVLVMIGFFSESVFSFQPDPMDAVGMSRKRPKEAMGKLSQIHSEWNIVGRIEAWKQEGKKMTLPDEVDYRIVTVDSGASTVMVGNPGKSDWGKGLFEETLYGLAYRAKPKPKQVLVIGTGGGIDVQTALHYGADRVTAVEINSSTIKALKGKFASFLKWPKDKRVEIVHADGRAFSKSPKKKFDVIQMSGVDTLTMYATGAFNMVEEYLYTVDAFEDYLSALKPDGVLCISRFGVEHFRLSTIAYEALRRQGISSPLRHIAALKQGRFVAIVVAKRELNKNQIDAMHALTDRKKSNGVFIPPYDRFNLHLRVPIKPIFLPGQVVKPKFRSYYKTIKRRASKDQNRFLAKSIPTDDNPFYLFTCLLKGQILAPVKNTISLLKQFWMATIVIALALIILPVAIFGRKLTSPRPLSWVLPFFFLIGAGFMTLEVGIINWFSIFMGSPGASTAVVLTATLIASGIGSYISELGRWGPEKKIVLATGLLIVSCLGLKFLTPYVFEACWKNGMGQVLRGVVAGAMVAPMGFSMGWFFPAGLKAIDIHMSDKRLVPWAISINGFASVAGSIAALPISVFYGFNLLLLFALGGYLIAGVLSFVYFRKSGTVS